MNQVEAQIVAMRFKMRMSLPEIGRRLGIHVNEVNAKITRLKRDGWVPPAPEPEPKIEAEPPVRPMGIPPSKLPEGRAGYDCAARWLETWGHAVVWKRFGKSVVPEIDGKLSNVVALCDLYFEGRRRWAAKKS